MKLTKKQKAIFNLLEPALVGHKLPLECSVMDSDGNPLIKANRVVTKRAVNHLVFDLFADSEPEQAAE